MWSYYGSKTNIVKLYPKPKEDKIIEPFAGYARYALQHFEKEVLLVDKYKVIVDIWKWLQKCSEQDILKLPRQQTLGMSIDDINFDCQEAKDFYGFMCGCADSRPRKTMGKRKAIDRPNFTNFGLKRVASQLFKIRHWKIEHGSYDNIPNQRATWFIDPPYQFGGDAYVESNKQIDFKSLAKWSTCREGQVIVCENTKADWMDFKPMIKQRGSLKSSTEAIWSNELTPYDYEQQTLFP